MAVTDDERIQSLVKLLDEAVPREGDVEVLAHEPANPVVRANKLGYLRLGVEFLKVAYAPVSRDAEGEVVLVDPDLTYLTGIVEPCYSFERREDVRKAPVAPEEPLGVFARITIGLFVVVFLGSLLVGFLTIFGWLGSAFKGWLDTAFR